MTIPLPTGHRASALSPACCFFPAPAFHGFSGSLHFSTVIHYSMLFIIASLLYSGQPLNFLILHAENTGEKIFSSFSGVPIMYSILLQVYLKGPAFLFFRFSAHKFFSGCNDNRNSQNHQQHSHNQLQTFYHKYTCSC